MYGICDLGRADSCSTGARSIRFRAGRGRIGFRLTGRRKQVYKITYPNGTIYVGMDLTGTLTYFGTPSAKAKELIVADLEAQRLDLTVREEILWESETATHSQVRAIEIRLIREHRANDPEIGYNGMIPTCKHKKTG
jgi:hypothetical protein